MNDQLTLVWQDGFESALELLMELYIDGEILRDVPAEVIDAACEAVLAEEGFA
jgi:hypothetical protein